MAEVKIGCLLSGGLDSSLVTALVVREARALGLEYKIQTFSIGMEGSTDLEAARKVKMRGRSRNAVNTWNRPRIAVHTRDRPRIMLNIQDRPRIAVHTRDRHRNVVHHVS